MGWGETLKGDSWWIVVGAGPVGMLAALLLAQEGSLDVVPADYLKTARPLGMEPAVITAENKGVFSSGLGSSTEGNVAIVPQIEELKERMMNDKGIMSLISAMQNDPEMQALLNDPAIMSAIQSGDIGTLINSPAFMKLLGNPRVREIEKSPGTRWNEIAYSNPVAFG